MCKTLHYKSLVQHILKQIYATTPVGAHPLPVDELRSYFLFGTEILRKHKTFWETFHKDLDKTKGTTSDSVQ